VGFVPLALSPPGSGPRTSSPARQLARSRRHQGRTTTATETSVQHHKDPTPSENNIIRPTSSNIMHTESAASKATQIEPLPSNAVRGCLRYKRWFQHEKCASRQHRVLVYSKYRDDRNLIHQPKVFPKKRLRARPRTGYNALERSTSSRSEHCQSMFGFRTFLSIPCLRSFPAGHRSFPSSLFSSNDKCTTFPLYRLSCWEWCVRGSSSLLSNLLVRLSSPL